MTKRILKVGHKPGVYGIFDGDKATGQVGTEDEMRALLDQPKVEDKPLSVWALIAGAVAVIVFVALSIEEALDKMP